LFESLTERLGGVLSALSRKGKLSEKDIDQALREVRLALLEADVDFKVARAFVADVKERALGEDLFASLTPGQTIIKIVGEELARILGGQAAEIQRAENPPSVIMLAGLQGSGKTTTAAKLALKLRTDRAAVMMAACDLRRPAAIDQLIQLGRQLNVPVYHEDPASSTPAQVAINAIDAARRDDVHWLLLDTGGRLHIDDEMMVELEDVRDAAQPVETLLVVDAMTGQDAVRSGSEFHERIGLTGIVVTKLDGDARGGAALSMRSVTGLPIKYVGVGEKPDGLEQFHPDRMASRILGMGDVQTLIEKAEHEFDTEQAVALEKKLRHAQFDMNDLLDQFRTVRRMGSVQDILGMVPGMGAVAKRVGPQGMDESKLGRVEAMILSMTPAERGDPRIINGSRRRRIALGSGTSPSEVNQLLGQFKQMQKMMKRLASGGSPRALMSMFQGRG